MVQLVFGFPFKQTVGMGLEGKEWAVGPGSGRAPGGIRAK